MGSTGLFGIILLKCSCILFANVLFRNLYYYSLVTVLDSNSNCVFRILECNNCLNVFRLILSTILSDLQRTYCCLCLERRMLMHDSMCVYTSQALIRSYMSFYIKQQQNSQSSLSHPSQVYLKSLGFRTFLDDLTFNDQSF